MTWHDFSGLESTDLRGFFSSINRDGHTITLEKVPFPVTLAQRQLCVNQFCSSLKMIFVVVGATHVSSQNLVCVPFLVLKEAHSRTYFYSS